MSQKIRRNPTLGNNIRNLRLKSNLTQEQVTIRLQLCGLDTSRSIYSQIESGTYNIKVEELIALKSIFNCSFDDFFLNIL